LPEADQAASDVEERFVNVGAALVADTEAPVLMQPGDRTLDDPNVLCRARSRAPFVSEAWVPALC
jgi:hypothetical protein